CRVCYPRTTTSLESNCRVPLFKMLVEKSLVKMHSIPAALDAPTGHALMERGQAGNGMFIIEEGSVRVEIPGDDDVILGPGSFVGELSVLADTPRTARVAVAEPIKGVAIRRNDLDDLLETEPAITLAMLRAMARRFSGPA